MATLFVLASTVPFLALVVWFYFKAAPALDRMHDTGDDDQGSTP